MAASFLSLQAVDAFTLTPSNTLDVKSDPNNTAKTYPSCYVHCGGTAGVVRVIPAGNTAGTTVDIYVAQGQTSSIAVSRVLVTGTTATGLIAFIGKGNI